MHLARSLSVSGARLILDPTAWVTTGRDPATITSPQPEFLMSVRALENGVWIAAANEVGVERDSVVYCGRSSIFAPDGSQVVMAGTREPEVISCDVDFEAAGGPPVPRRPNLYRWLDRPSEELPVWERVRQPIVPSDAVFRVGLLQPGAIIPSESLSADAAERRTVVDALAIDLLAAVTSAEEADPERLGREVRNQLGRPVALGTADPAGRVTACVLATEQGVVHLLPTHGPQARGSDDLRGRLFDIGELRVAVLVGLEGLVPEVARVFALEGAELLIWFADTSTPLAEAVARRAIPAGHPTRSDRRAELRQEGGELCASPDRETESPPERESDRDGPAHRRRGFPERPSDRLRRAARAHR